MPKLPVLSHDHVCRVLRRNGFERRRETKHTSYWTHPGDPERRTRVPRHKQIARGTLHTVIRGSKKPREEFAT